MNLLLTVPLLGLLFNHAALAEARPTKDVSSRGQTIKATYYGAEMGRHARTASGEPFRPGGMTAAHRSLPFGTRLLVINPRNGRKVTVRINDRGPFRRGYSLDLAQGAARVLGFSSGTLIISRR